MCHFTRTEFLLNETKHKACSSTDNNLLLNGLCLVFDLYILSYKPHCFACPRLKTLTLALVSAMIFAREVLNTTSILRSLLRWFVLFDVVTLQRIILYISSGSSLFLCLCFYKTLKSVLYFANYSIWNWVLVMNFCV